MSAELLEILKMRSDCKEVNGEEEEGGPVFV